MPDFTSPWGTDFGSRQIRLTIDGQAVVVAPGTTVAAAVWNGGEAAFRHSVEGEPRAPLCGMGICFECRLEIDGRLHERSCNLPCRPGMVVRTARSVVESSRGEGGHG